MYEYHYVQGNISLTYHTVSWWVDDGHLKSLGSISHVCILGEEVSPRIAPKAMSSVWMCIDGICEGHYESECGKVNEIF